MIPLPTLNDQEYEEIIDKAIRQINQYGDSWIDRGAHDIGVMLLEMFSFIKVIQQESIDKITENSVYKFLQLIDIEPEGAKPSEINAVVKVNTDITIPKGYKFNFYGTTFESKEKNNLLQNNIKSIGYCTEDRIELSEYNLNDIGRIINVFSSTKNQREFVIGFSNPLELKKKIGIRFDIYEDYIVKRNRIQDRNSFINLARLSWEYYGCKNGIYGWHEISIAKDETYNFILSGNVCFSIDGQHIGYGNENAYLIKIKLLEDGYEVYPKINSLQLNSFELKQQDTKIENIDFTYREFKDNKMIFESYIARNQSIELYINVEGAWELASDHGIIYMIKEYSEFKFILGCSKIEYLNKMLLNKREEDKVFKLVIYENNFLKETMNFSSDGTSNQRIESKIKGILRENFEILVARRVQGKYVWDEWSKVQELEYIDELDNVYEVNEEDGLIIFGDNEHGKIPEKLNGNIKIVGLKNTKGSSGNIREGVINEIKSCTEGEEIDYIDIVDCKIISKGKDKENIVDLIQRARKVMNQCSRAISIHDYEKIVKSVEGLMVENVTVIPLYKKGKKFSANDNCENVVTIIVEPYLDRVHNRFYDAYRENIKNKLQKCKLLTTEVLIEFPEYIGLDLYGDIIIKPYYKDAEITIRNAINNYIKERQKNELGKPIYYGDLYGVIDSLECVYKIKYLKLQVDGEIVSRNDLGDIEIPPYARIYLKSYNVKFLY